MTNSIPETMKVAVMTDLEKIGWEIRKVPEPSADEVLVKLEYVGVCGSDLHFYETGRIGSCVVIPPFVLGHEPGGVVVKVGSAVTNLKVGDRVALEPGKTCGKCEFCKSGRYNLCPEVIFFATPPVNGVFSEYTAHPSNLCFKLPDNVSTMEGALIEPLAVGFHACEQGQASAGKKALVFGSGCIGLCCAMALKAYGVESVTVADIQDKRLNKALELGADHAFNTKENGKEELLGICGKDGFDLIIETAGTEVTTRLAIELAKKGGTIVLIGYSRSGEMTLPMSLIIDKELTLKSVFRYRYVYPKAIRAVSEGKVKLSKLATNVFEFDDLQNAMDQSLHNKVDIVKSVIHIG